MAKYTPYAVTVLPTGGAIDINGIYFLKQSSQSFFSIFIRKNDNSGWVSLADTPVTMVNGLTGAVQLDLNFNTTTGVLSLTGSGVSVNLDARYDKITDNISWARIINRPTTLGGYGITDAATDANVLHKTGNETKDGTLTLSSSPVIPAGSASNHAVNKGQMDGADATLQTQITALQSQVNTGVQQAQPLDCSTNPNYPSATAGQRWRVTAAGKIGGASGVNVEQNDVIECVTATSGGTHAAVGGNFIIQQANIDSATETVQGYARKATVAEAIAGSNDAGFMTSYKTQLKLDSMNVRFDINAQGLTSTQKQNARTNINAASLDDVQWGQKDW